MSLGRAAASVRWCERDGDVGPSGRKTSIAFGVVRVKLHRDCGMDAERGHGDPGLPGNA